MRFIKTAQINLNNLNDLSPEDAYKNKRKFIELLKINQCSGEHAISIGNLTLKINMKRM